MSKVRTFRISFAIGIQEEVNKFMRNVDLFQGTDSGIISTGTVTTTNTLPFEEYKALTAKAFEDGGGKLYDIEEIIK